MALMKAKIANEKAASVDRTALVVQEIAEYIRYAVSEGRFFTQACVYKEHEAVVRLQLQKAGYSVSSVAFLPQLYEPSTWARLLNWLGLRNITADCEDVAYGYEENVVRLNVDWSLIRETKTA